MTDSSSAPFAWVQHKDQVYYSRSTSIDPHLPSSPLIKLLQGLFDEHKDLSFFILRNRIFLNYTPPMRDLGMIKLIAKRHSVVGPITPERTTSWIEVGSWDADFFPVKAERTALDWSREDLLQKTHFKSVLEKYENQIPRGPILHDHPRKIAAFVFDENGLIFGANAHSGAINKTLHAEVCLIQDLARRGHRVFPERASMLVSMKPCQMCAAMIADFLPPNFSGQILYWRDDPGPKARNTALDSKPFFRQLAD